MRGLLVEVVSAMLVVCFVGLPACSPLTLLCPLLPQKHLLLCSALSRSASSLSRTQTSSSSLPLISSSAPPLTRHSAPQPGLWIPLLPFSV